MNVVAIGKLSIFDIGTLSRFGVIQVQLAVAS